MIADEWERATGRPAPRLVRAFATDPDAALDALLTGAAGATLAQRGPAGVLTAWLSALPPNSELARAVDIAVTRRIAVDWEPHMETEGVGRRRALRLVRLFDIVSSTPGRLVYAPAELGERFPTRGDALAPWSPSPSQDPLGRYLLALARTQPDRSRAPFWFAHCRLPASVPLFRAEYGIAGLRGLPSAEPADDEFPYEVASGLRVLADGIRRGVLDGRFDVMEATRTFESIGQICIASYPLSGWSDELLIDNEASDSITLELLRDVAALDRRAITAEALRRAFAAPTQQRSAAGSQPRPGRAPGRRERPVTTGRVLPLLTALSRGEQGAVARAQNVIDTERARVQRAGDFASEIGALLAQASAAARKHFADTAVVWAEEALAWEPWDVRAWTVVTAAYRAAERPADGLDAAWRAQARFPHNPHVWAELGQVLADDCRISAAEAVLTEAIHRFPDNPVATSAYGEMLIATGRAADAVPILEEATAHFEPVAASVPQIRPLWAGLTAALISTGRTGEAQRTAQWAYELFPDDPLAKQRATNFDRFRRERIRRDVAYAEAEPPPPAEEGTLYSATAEARVLRQRARETGLRGGLDLAWGILERNRGRGGEDPRFIAEMALVRADRGEAEQALQDVQASPFRDSTDVSVALAATRAKRIGLLTSAEPNARRYSEARMAELTAEMNIVARSNAAVRPLQLLTRLQSSAALSDGAAVAAEREHAYRDMTTWIRRTGDPLDRESMGPEDEELAFTSEWSHSLAAVWRRMSTAAPGEEIAELVEEASDALDALQETFEHRLASLA